MAAANYSSDVLQAEEVNKNNCMLQATSADKTITELIRYLPWELKELILKKFIATKMEQRSDLGWNDVHQELEKTPLCRERQSLVKVMFCFDHGDCGIDGICEPCLREGFCHKVFPEINEYNSERRFIVPCNYEVEHAWITCMLNG